MKSKVYLIRHGITEGNKKDWYYGALELHLEPEGVEEIRRLASCGVYPDIEDAQVFTSGMIRTEETLFNMYGREIPHDTIEELKEYNYGMFEGLTYDEVMALEEGRTFTADKENVYVIPGGESRSMFDERVLKGWKKLVGFHRLKELSHRHSGLPATTVTVCHGGVIDRIIHFTFGEKDEPRFKWIPEPGHGYAVSFENGEPVSYEVF